MCHHIFFVIKARSKDGENTILTNFIIIDDLLQLTAFAVIIERVEQISQAIHKTYSFTYLSVALIR